MASILKPFNLLSSGNFQVPNGTQLSIDNSNLLASGLISCFVPGAMGGVDLCQTAPFLTPGGGVVFDDTIEGVGTKSTSTNSGLSATTGNTGLLGTITNCTVYWRGVQLGTPSASAVYFGISANNSNSSPFITFNVQADGNPTNLQPTFNSGGVFQNGNGFAIPAANTFFDMAATFNLTSNIVTMYKNGVSQATVSTYTSAAQFSATSTLSIHVLQGATTRFSNATCTIAAIWNRVLSAAEIAALSNAPYSFIIPAEYELPAITVGASGIKFRKTFSQIGGRVGTRQPINWGM